MAATEPPSSPITLTKGRVEAFSDGVIAIIITIMVLELKVPHGHEIKDILPLVPVFLSYVLSFVFVGIYWNNHHHMLHAVHRISGGVLWANLHLLFWLSLVPFATSWMGENHFETWPTVAYGVVLIMSALAYTILVRVLIACNGKESTFARAIGSDIKGNVSLMIYACGVASSFFYPPLGLGCYVVVALIWLIPDRRIEKRTQT